MSDNTYEKHVMSFRQGKAEIKVVIRKIWDYDACGMEDDLGRFTDKWEEGAFDRRGHDWRQVPNEHYVQYTKTATCPHCAGQGQLPQTSNLHFEAAEELCRNHRDFIYGVDRSAILAALENDMKNAAQAERDADEGLIPWVICPDCQGARQVTVRESRLEKDGTYYWQDPGKWSREYRYFMPEQSPENVEEALPYYRKHFAKHQAWLHANALPRYQYERAESLNNQNWGYIGITAELFVNGTEIASGSCWGFESDAEPSGWRRQTPWEEFERAHNLYDPLYHPGKYKNKAAYAYAMGERGYLTSEMEDIASECLHEAQRAANSDHGKDELTLRRWFKKELKTKTIAQLADWIVANAEEERIR